MLVKRRDAFFIVIVINDAIVSLTDGQGICSSDLRPSGPRQLEAPQDGDGPALANPGAWLQRKTARTSDARVPSRGLQLVQPGRPHAALSRIDPTEL